MKPVSTKSDKIGKGAPSGFVISLIFHAAAFFIAGLFVVFTVLPKEEPEFTAPPPVERPKMKLKKPKVKIKKSSQPKPSSRIVAKVKTAKMPEIQIPDLVGTGEGLMGGLGMGGEFMDLPDIGEISVFGSEESNGYDLVGSFYDLKRYANGSMSVMASDSSKIPVYLVLRKFMESGWNTSVLKKYYQSSRKLYSSTVIIPETPSITGPMAFGEDAKTGGWAWAAVYEGTLVSYRDIRFRFWGMGDNFLAVGVDGETVLATWLDGLDNADASYFAEFVQWKAQPTPMTYAYGHEGAWIDLKAGEPRKLQVIVSETDGGASSYMLCVEEEGVDYPPSGYRGGTTYPIFQTAVQSRSQVEDLERVIYPGDASVNEGPVFQDFPPKEVAGNADETKEDPVEEEPEAVSKVRTWSLADGRSIAAELANQTADTAWIKTEDGHEVKVLIEQLSEADQLYLRLTDVPKFRIDFTEKIDVPPPPPTPRATVSSKFIAEIKYYSFKARVKIMDSSRYTYPLTVEYFAIGREREGKNNFVLWERSSKTFTPSRENDYRFEFGSKKSIQKIVKSMTAGSSRMRGEDYDTYLVTVTDQRGEIIAYRTPNKFLFEHLDRLKEIPITRHFDNECRRVAPSRPIDSDRLWADRVFTRSQI